MPAAPLTEKPALPTRSLRRRWGLRPSGTHVVMLVAALVAFFVSLAALRDPHRPVQLAAAGRELQPGAAAEPGDLAAHEVVAGADALPGLLTLAAARDLLAAGARPARWIPQGAVLTESDLVPASALETRTMSFPIDRAHAVGGRLTAGDRIDLVVVEGGSARFVMTGAPVVAVGEASGTGRTFSLTVEVGAADSLRLARALSAGSLSVVKSTWAIPADPGLVDPPPPADPGAPAGG